MKALKKKLTGILMAVVFCFSPVSAFAAEASVAIASGLELEEDEMEYTFDDSRIIYGEAAPDTKITFTICQEDSHGELQEIYAESLTVGSLGLFSVTLPLEKGYNYITMTAEADGCEETMEETIVKRLPQTVKKQLQNMLALPGLNGTF